MARSAAAELAYSVEGSGPETVLLVMGLGARAADWGTTFPAALAARYRVVRFDNRGVGRSPRAPAGYSLADLAADAVAVLDAVGASRAHVIGVSMGGMIAQLVALEHPERVARLVLVSTHHGGRALERSHPDALGLFDPVALLAGASNPEAAMRHAIGVITAPGFVERAPEVVAELVANARREPTHPAVFLAQFQAILASDRSERVRAISVPTLVIHGTEDKLIPPANGRELAARIPGARLVMLDACGHMPMHERADALAGHVLEFLDS
ncbi:MAG: alpha/beta fold hydrolase [Acidobacteriota bacterium]